MSDNRESSTQRGYGYRWQKARKHYLAKHPLCEMHSSKGQYVYATVVDHIRPHRGDMALFWDSSNWQALCKACHDRIKQAYEKSGRLSGCNKSGVPIDPSHHWHTGKGEGGGGETLTLIAPRPDALLRVQRREF